MGSQSDSSSQSHKCADEGPRASLAPALSAGGWTRGPLTLWHQPADCRGGDGLDWSLQTEAGDIVAMLALGPVGAPADLRLYAAAPDLYEALKEYREAVHALAPHFNEPAIDHLEKWLRLDRAGEQANAALALSSDPQPIGVETRSGPQTGKLRDQSS